MRRDGNMADTQSRVWRRYRDSAELILSRYGMHVVPSLPAMVLHWLTHENSAAVDTSKVAQKAFALAFDIHCLTHNVVDAPTGITASFPMGKDVAFVAALMGLEDDGVGDADTVDVALSVSERLKLAEAAIEAVRDGENRVVGLGLGLGGDGGGGYTASELDETRGDIEAVQVTVPYALGSELPLRIRDAAVVLEHIQSGSEDDAAKLAGTFGSQYAHTHAVRLARPGALDVSVFRRRLDAMCSLTPSLLYRALGAIGLIGDSDSTSAESIALQYARHVEALFERGVSMTQ